jgi:threonine dehydrogenase-like Zn-dependent dehydrogenase
MRMMKAQVLEKPNKMVLKDVPVPSIDDGEVLIKVKYCGICGSDWGSYTGKYADEVKCLPLTTGHEFFGYVEDVGKNVKNIKPGDRVAVDIALACGTCYFCRRNEPLLCTSFKQIGIHVPGAYAEYVKAPWQNCYIVPNEVTDYQAAFIEPLTTTLNASKKMDLKFASSLVVIGCGIGIIHAALGKARGAAPVIMVGDNAERLEMAKKMGTDYIIDITKTPDPVAEVMNLTDGIGADYVLEAVGTSETYEQSFEMVRRGGKVEAFGICADDDFAKIPPVKFVIEEKKVNGTAASFGNDWGDAIKLLQYKIIDPTPLISMIVPLAEVEIALKELRSNQKLIKVLVSPELKGRVVLNK